MNEAKNYTIRVLNDQYVICSDEPEELIHRATRMVDSYIQEALQKNRHVDPKKAAVLAALQFASQLLYKENQLNELAYREQELIAIVNEMS